MAPRLTLTSQGRLNVKFGAIVHHVKVILKYDTKPL